MKTMTTRHILTTLLLVLMGSGTAAVAQTFTLTGRVIDEENNPIELANVSCAAQGKL